MPQKAPPVTIVASTRLNLRQRSSPPWASTILASSLFMVILLIGRTREESRAAATLAWSGQSLLSCRTPVLGEGWTTNSTAHSLSQSIPIENEDGRLHNWVGVLDCLASPR